MKAASPAAVKSAWPTVSKKSVIDVAVGMSDAATDAWFEIIGICNAKPTPAAVTSSKTIQVAELAAWPAEEIRLEPVIENAAPSIRSIVYRGALVTTQLLIIVNTEMPKTRGIRRTPDPEAVSLLIDWNRIGNENRRGKYRPARKKTYKQFSRKRRRLRNWSCIIANNFILCSCIVNIVESTMKPMKHAIAVLFDHPFDVPM